MGMYDHIICEYKLPDNFDPSGILFQTKDLDNNLDTYRISAYGRLMHDYREWENTPEFELPNPEIPFIGSIREKEGSKKTVDMNYHGFIRFYSNNICGFGPEGFITNNDEEPWKREYTAKFTDGDLVSIALNSNKVEICSLKHIKRKDFHLFT